MQLELQTAIEIFQARVEKIARLDERPYTFQVWQGGNCFTLRVLGSFPGLAALRIRAAFPKVSITFLDAVMANEKIVH